MVKKKKWFYLVGVAVICVLLHAGDTRLTVVTYPYFTEKVNTGARIVHLSDLHSCLYDDLVETIIKQTPDVIFMTGDMVDDVLPQQPAWDVIEPLAEAFPCYYVTGNHEIWSRQADEICAQMEAIGVIVLRGNQVELTINGATIQIFGVDDPDTGLTMSQLEEFTPQEEALTLLLSHRPELVDVYGGYDLVFSGHAHGGQWRIPGILNGLYAPNQGLFPDYAGGMYPLEDTTLVVSRGLARESTKVPRIWNRPEVVVVDVIPV